ncbi:hypothetical protein LCGC14_0163400 [marine sediment metagenome]|uniref:Uncharacterized protein n=1 Tax=marine sediment metagenome TaxID=412755 RepID=A0A0F9XCH4_9ZZZZ
MDATRQAIRKILYEADADDEGGLNRVWLDHPVLGKETVGEYLERHGIPILLDGTVELYHGRPKRSDYDVLRAGTYVADSPKDAAFYAARDRNLRPHQVEVIKLRLKLDEINPGVHISLRKDVKI